MKKLFLLLALLGMVAVGCSKDEVDKGNDNKTEQPNENEGGNEETPVFEIDPEGNYVVESEGGEVLLEVTTNLEYSVYIPKDARSWLFYEETRAVRTETVVLSVEPNSDTELRTATVELRDAEGETLEHFTIVQKPYGIIEDDEPEEEDPIFESDNEGNYSITAEGGEIVVTVATNLEYSVVIPMEAQSWISVADTRAVRLEKIVFIVAANDTMAERCADITLIDTAGEVLQDFTITQGAERNITCNNNEIIYTTKYGYAIDFAITDGFGGNYVSHTFEGGYGKIIFDNDVVTIPLNAFRDCNSITNIYLPSCVQEIGKGAFYGCESLASITIPDSLTKIGEWAFAGCALEYVAIDTLSHWCNITFVDDQANPLFYSNDLLVGGEVITTLTIPEDITTINPYAFRGWKNLTNITIHDSVTTIGKYAFSVCKNLSEITIGSGVTTIGDRAFYGCGGVLNINCNIPSVSNYESVPFYNAKLTTVNIGDSVEVVGDYAFWGCDTLTEVNLGNGVQSIGKDAFAYCTGLTYVIIPDSVAEIGNYIFYECSNLSEVVIGSGVTTIGDRAFYNCSSLTSVTIPDSVTSIGNYAFSGCTSELIIYSKIIETDYSFDNRPTNGGWLNGAKFTKLIIGDSVTTIGNYAFSSCESLTSVTISDSVTSIGHGAFEDCSSLTSVTIGDSVTSIGDYAFYSCSSLTSITIPDSVTTIGYQAFRNCDSLTSITIPDSVTTIGDGAFYECSSLTSVTIGDSVTTIGNYAFYNCSSLTSVTISDSVTTIGEYAFNGCSSLASVTISDSVTMIGDAAFSGCSNLQEFNGKFASEDGRCLIIDGTLNSFAPVGLTEYTIPDSVTSIGGFAFNNCGKLTSVTIGDNVTSIGYSAFEYCSSLSSVTIPNSVTSIGGFAFSNCSSLTSVTIPDSVTTIGDYAFVYCESLTSVTIPDSVTTIGDYAFVYCESLTSVTIPDSVTTIGDYAFVYCESLTSVTIPDSVTTIGDHAFYDCSSLASVTIGDSVTTIGYEAFANCIGLSSVYCKATTPPAVTLDYYYDWCAFNDNASGRKIYVPMESVEAYKSAEGWSDYESDIVGYNF